jgi:hypothetical protein
MRAIDIDLDSIAQVGKGLARKVRRQLLIRAIETAQTLADQETLVAAILGLALRVVEDER